MANEEVITKKESPGNIWNTIKEMVITPFNTVLIKPLSENIILTFLIGGTIIFVTGILLNESKLSEIMEEGGKTILAAGVFVAIIKSSQFTNLFKRHIYEVFYEPSEISEIPELKQNWRKITDAILEKTLPVKYRDASSGIMKQFLTAELQYHFEKYEAEYSITVDENTNIATIFNRNEMILIISPNLSRPPVLEQNVEVIDGLYESIYLEINGVEHQSGEYLKPIGENKWIFSLPLKDHIQINKDTGEEYVRILRRYQIEQDIVAEPYLMGTMKRYVKGLRLKAKIQGPYGINFIKIGLSEPDDEDIVGQDDGEFTSWVIASPETLLLPGQGYILVILPTVGG